MTQKEFIETFIFKYGDICKHKLNKYKIEIKKQKELEILKLRKQKRNIKFSNNFFKEANKVHKKFYTYPDKIYVNARTKVKIECPIHEIFYQIPASHLSGSGCPKCFNKLRGKNVSLNFINYYKNNLRGKELGHLYQICIFNTNEIFYKIGITSNTILERYYNNLPKEYQYIILNDNIMSNLETAEKEKEILKNNKQFEYIPQIKFGGYTECFHKRISLFSFIS